MKNHRLENGPGGLYVNNQPVNYFSLYNRTIKYSSVYGEHMINVQPGQKVYINHKLIKNF